MTDFDVIVIGAGPGGYVAAIRAAQLGKKVAIVEKENLGGICLNWGCIPTKALLKSAQIVDYAKNATDFGVDIKNIDIQLSKIVDRSRAIANDMQNGIQYLMKKNNITIIYGYGKLLPGKKVEVTSENEIKTYTTQNIVIATGSTAKSLSAMPIDNQYIIDYRKAMTLAEQPKDIIIVGAGAIGVEFAYFYNAMGSHVTLVEYSKHILPNEDTDVSKELEKILMKKGITIHTSTKVVQSNIENELVTLKAIKDNSEIEISSTIVISAVGILPNIDNIGLEYCHIKTNNGKIETNEYYQTSVDGIYAIGDITKGQALAHVASAEGIVAAEHIAKQACYPINYNNILSCVYCMPEIASVGYTEQYLIENNREYLVGKFPFSASGKAKAMGKKEGFVKILIDKKYDEILGAHAIGENVSEILQEIVLARDLEATATTIVNSVHAHPTISETIKEAIELTKGHCIHL